MPQRTTSLRPLTRAHSHPLFAEVFAGEDPDPNGYLFKEARPATLAEVEALVGWLADGTEAGRFEPYVFLDELERIVGWGYITLGDEGESPEISFLIGPRHRGHGHATRAVAQLTAAALAHEMPSVEAVVHLENQAVRHILADLGFAVVSDPSPSTNEETWAKNRD